MIRLRHIVVFTTDLARLRDFYEDRVGLEPSIADPHWTAYRTRGAILALHPLAGGATPYVELAFETADLEATMRDVEHRGGRFTEPIQDEKWSARIRLHDTEGNRLALVQPKLPTMETEGPEIVAAMVHARDLAAAGAFYRDVLGLETHEGTSSRVWLVAGATMVALTPSITPGAKAVGFGLAVPELPLWVDEARVRGLTIADPVDRGFGSFADAIDPDGNPITFFEASEPVSEEERLAEPFEDDGALARAPFRKPPKKGSKAVGRITVGLGYAGSATKRKAEARPKRQRAAQRVASARGSGPAGSRVKPKRTADSKRARAKPAIGRLKKAELRTLAQHKRAVARASKGKPIKRAAARDGKRS